MAGFSEAVAPFDGLAAQAPATPAPVRVKVGPDGRVLVPAELRRAAGWVAGETVLVTLRDGEVCLASLTARTRQLQGLFAHVRRPGVDEVDAFLEDKRADALRE